MTRVDMQALDDIARLLVAARVNRTAVPAAGLDLPDAEAAYAVQHAVATAMGWFRHGPAQHWKSGGPSRQSMLTHAPLPPDGVWASPADAASWPFLRRGIEAEVALRLGCGVDADQAASLQPAQLAGMFDAMCVAIEVVDSRWAEGLSAPAMAKLADLQSHGALVLGDWLPFEARDWSAQVCRVQIGANPPIERRGSHALADPLYGLPAWLRHATAGGQRLSPGTVVTTGTWVGILDADTGARVTVEFPGIGQASIQL